MRQSLPGNSAKDLESITKIAAGSREPNTRFSKWMLFVCKLNPVQDNRKDFKFEAKLKTGCKEKLYQRNKILTQLLAVSIPRRQTRGLLDSGRGYNKGYTPSQENVQSAKEAGHLNFPLQKPGWDSSWLLERVLSHWKWTIHDNFKLYIAAAAWRDSQFQKEKGEERKKKICFFFIFFISRIFF